MDSAQRAELARAVLLRSKADQTEVLIRTGDAALTRFAHGVCNQSVAASDHTISVRAVAGGRTGVAATNRFDERALDEVVHRAAEMASFAAADPLQPALPGNLVQHQAPKGAYFTQTAHADAFTRAHEVDAIVTEVENAGYWGSGFVSTSSVGITIANNSGAFASFDGTDAASNVKVTAPDSTGFAERHSADVGALDGARTGHRAVDKARSSAGPKSVDPGLWTVILEPAAFGELLAYVASHFSAQAYDEGSSFFSGKLGTKLFPETLTVRDDYANELAPGMPFDYEAHPKERLTLVDRGVVTNVVTDSYYAHKLHMRNTGHALPAPNAHGPQPLNIVVEPGHAGTDELIAGTQRGLLITRFWYIRTVDQKQAIVTGMTRDGTFLIEHGRITTGVRNLRFNQSIVEALTRAVFSRDLHRTGSYTYSLVVPSAKIEGFRFTSTTQF